MFLMFPVEHDAVSEQGEVLGVEIYAPDLCGEFFWGVWEYSDLGPAEFERAALMSMTWVCSELGTIEPRANLPAPVHDAQTEQAPLLHSDAAQAIGYCDVNFAQSGLDLLSIGGHKVGAPKLVRVHLTSVGASRSLTGPGGDERGIRS